MFEAVLAVCLEVSDSICRDQLLPGYEAATQDLCKESLAARPPNTATGLIAAGEPTCRPVGEILSFEEVAPGAFAHLGQIAEPDLVNRGDVSNVGFVVGEESVAVIDTGTAPWMGEAIWRAIRSRTDKPVGYVILTHNHPDHVFGTMPLAAAGAKVIGHAALARALSDRQANYVESLAALIGPQEMVGVGPIRVDQPVETEATIDLGGRVLELRAWPSAHTGSDLTVTDRNSGIMFTGDLVFHVHTPALDGRLLGWTQVLEDMKALEISRIVPGHGGPVLDWPDGIFDQQRYLDVLLRDTRQTIEAGTRLGDAVETIAASEAEHWELFEAYNPRNATVAYTELEWE